MVWWLDEGSIVGGGRQGVLCTEGFDRASVEILLQYLHKVWDIGGRIGVTKSKTEEKKETYRIYLNTSELKKFLILIMPHIPVKEMVAKVRLRYKDKEMQQRWISEMERNLTVEIPTENDIVQEIPIGNNRKTPLV